MIRTPVVDCFSCSEAAASDLPPRSRILRTEHWRVVHTFEDGLLGWLVALPVRHVTALAELGPDEAAELGPLIVDLSRALTAEVGCVKTYVMQFAEAPGFGHVHVHVVPRAADLPAGLRGPRVFGALSGGVPATDPAVLAAQDRLAEALTARLSALRG
jgi:diadenosine tetraphosphate (Ap4A) HIT family hydrolase